MAIMKWCSGCRKLIPVGTKCSCMMKRYKPPKDDIRLYYHTQEWDDVRTKAIARTFGLDAVDLILYNRITYGDVVHHIIPIRTNYSLRNNIDNLIYLSDRNHHIVHDLYKSDYDNTVKKLKQILSDFAKIYG